MRDRLVIGVLIAAALLMLAAPLYAFDDERKGFIIGFGLGSGMIKETATVEFDPPIPIIGSSVSNDVSSATISTSFRIGWAPSQRLAIYYLQDVVWNRETGEDPDTGESESLWDMTGLGGIGATFYLGPRARSFYVLGAFGFSTWTVPFEAQNDFTKTWFGTGAEFGGGWEFADHLSVEVKGMWGKPEKSGQGWKGNIDAFSVLVLFQAIAY